MDLPSFGGQWMVELLVGFTESKSTDVAHRTHCFRKTEVGLGLEEPWKATGGQRNTDVWVLYSRVCDSL